MNICHLLPVFLRPRFYQMDMLNTALEGYCIYSSPDIHPGKTVKSSPVPFFLRECGAEIDFRHLAVVLLYFVQIMVFSKGSSPFFMNHSPTHTINKHHDLNKLNQKLGQQYLFAGSFLFSARFPLFSSLQADLLKSLVFLTFLQ